MTVKAVVAPPRPYVSPPILIECCNQDVFVCCGYVVVIEELVFKMVDAASLWLREQPISMQNSGHRRSSAGCFQAPDCYDHTQHPSTPSKQQAHNMATNKTEYYELYRRSRYYSCPLWHAKIM
jgi:hypothetical protein